MKTTDTAMVQAVQPYMEGREHKDSRSAPYEVPRWHAEELKANGFAEIVGDPKPGPATEPDVEQPDDNSAATRAPVAAAQGGPLSTVPAKPGDQPVTPTRPAKKRTPGRGRPARRQP